MLFKELSMKLSELRKYGRTTLFDNSSRDHPNSLQVGSPIVDPGQQGFQVSQQENPEMIENGLCGYCRDAFFGKSIVAGDVDLPSARHRPFNLDWVVQPHDTTSCTLCLLWCNTLLDRFGNGEKLKTGILQESRYSPYVHRDLSTWYFYYDFEKSETFRHDQHFAEGFSLYAGDSQSVNGHPTFTDFNEFDEMIKIKPLASFRVQVAPGYSPIQFVSLPPSISPPVGLAQEWINDCLENHVKCKERSSTFMPTRLLRISNSGSSLYRAKLVRSNGSMADYVALSHRWGNNQPIRTLQENYGAHVQCIPLPTLPKTFQDAIRTTIELGYHHLWIDSLCIIQDSEIDWQQECQRMEDIYANAVLTIAASDANDSTVGYLDTKRTGFITQADHPIYVQPGPANMHNTTIITADKCLLDTRGWVLQESFLSSRLLSFKMNRMEWTCRESRRLEGVAQELVEYVFQKEQEHRLRTGIYSYKNWYLLMEAYSSCSLTRPTDKLPAISGLARSFAKQFFDDTYLAGLWLGDIREGLGWAVARQYDAPHPEDTFSIFKASGASSLYLGPTWSWASIDHPVRFQNGVYRFPSEEPPMLTILSTKIVPNGIDPYGGISSASLTVRGRVGILQLGVYCAWSMRASLGWIILDSETSFLSYDNCKDQNVPSTFKILQLTDTSGIIIEPFVQHTTRRAATYRRIGHIEIERAYHLPKGFFWEDAQDLEII